MITNIAIHIILTLLFLYLFLNILNKNVFSIYLNSKYVIMYKYVYTLY